MTQNQLSIVGLWLQEQRDICEQRIAREDARGGPVAEQFSKIATERVMVIQDLLHLVLAQMKAKNR